MKNILYLTILSSILSATTINIPADYSTIQEGIDVSDNGDTVLVADGVYYENLSIDKEITLASHYILEADTSHRDATIIDGSNYDEDSGPFGSCVLFRPSDNGEAISAEVTGFTIRNGKGTRVNETIVLPDGNEHILVYYMGGGFMIDHCLPVIEFNLITNNGVESTGNRGGGSQRGGGGAFNNSDGVEFDEDRSEPHPRTTLTRDDHIIISNNIFEDNVAETGHTFESIEFSGNLNFSGSHFDVAYTDETNPENNGVSEYWITDEGESSYSYTNINGDLIAITYDVWVSPDGVDAGSSTGTDEHPFRTIDYALNRIYPTEENPITINLSDGTYSPTNTGEYFPILLFSNVNLIGQGEDVTIIDAELTARVINAYYLTNSTISNLSITGGNLIDPHLFFSNIGGGISICYSSMTIHQVTVINNTTINLENIMTGGGGISILYSNPILTNMKIFSNSSDQGGAFKIEASDVIMNNVIISGNQGYAALFIGGSDLLFTDVEIINNNSSSAGGDVGGLEIGDWDFVPERNIMFMNVLISNNSTVGGHGGMRLNHCDPILINLTMTENEDTWGLGGLSLYNSNPVIINSIIWNNSGENIYSYDGYQNTPPSNPFVTYSNIEGGWEGEGNIDADPLFVDPVNGDFNLQEGSPCIDAGTAFFEWEGDILVNMNSEDYYGNAPDMGAFEYGMSGGTDITVFYNTDWNIVGLPLEVANGNYQNLFLNVYSGTLYSHDINYQPEQTLETGGGYLLRFIDDESVTFSGIPLNEITLSLSAGWNLFSGLSTALMPEYLYSFSIIQDGTLNGLDGDYFSPESIEPGIGYWVRATEGGEITLTSGSFVRQVPFVNRMNDANSISFFNESYSTNLYFGVDVPEDERLSYSLPPTFPQMAFDVRFSGDMKYVVDSGEIGVLNHSETLNIGFDIKVEAGENLNWVLTTESGKKYILEGTGELTVPSAERFVLNRGSVIPITFALHQNLPNPFNPITTLRYDLPSDALVTLIIYDMLGKEVTQLINSVQDAGYRSVQWDATNMHGKPVSAGLYLYTIQAGEFRQSKKMILLK